MPSYFLTLLINNKTISIGNFKIEVSGEFNIFSKKFPVSMDAR